MREKERENRRSSTLNAYQLPWKRPANGPYGHYFLTGFVGHTPFPKLTTLTLLTTLARSLCSYSLSLSLEFGIFFFFFNIILYIYIYKYNILPKKYINIIIVVEREIARSCKLVKCV